MSELNDMTCAELADVAAELALGVLTGRERAMAVAHLQRCEECREDVRQLMATGEQLVQLLPAAEPPAGFETRVLARIGLSAPAPEPAEPRTVARPSRPSRPSRLRRGLRVRSRRVLTTAALAVAVAGAGLGGWGIGTATSPAGGVATASLTTAPLLSAAHQEVGDLYHFTGDHRWWYMTVYLGSGNETVNCQLVNADGTVTSMGTFRLHNGHGGWGAAAPQDFADLSGARLVTTGGTVLASATFTH